MRTRLVTVAAGLAAVFAGSGAMLAHAAGAAVTVQANDFKFCSSADAGCLPTGSNYTTTVDPGTRITWVYTDTECDILAVCPGHNVVFANGSGNKTLVKKDGATIFSETFNTPGSYTYVCTFHQQFGMTGTVVVRNPATSGGSSGSGAASGGSSGSASGSGSSGGTGGPSAASGGLPSTGTPALATFLAGLSALLAGIALLWLGQDGRHGLLARVAMGRRARRL
jgi:plastocyanin